MNPEDIAAALKEEEKLDAELGKVGFVLRATI